MRTQLNRTRSWRLGVFLTPTLFAACSGASLPEADRPQAANKWFLRAQHEYQSADIDNARDAIARALAMVPTTDTEVRLLAARIALARLDYAETLRLLKETSGSEAAGMRGRALWYKGDLEGAADELEAMLNDPDVVDDWAKSIVKLARGGAGRVPFALSGALLTALEMPHVSPVAPFFVVDVEIDGEAALAMVSTGTGEVVLDSATRKEPSWVSLRFNKKLEVHDVPALAQDLSGISKQMGAPIKALLGVNLLRHLNATIDYAGRQFVARAFAPPAPPNSTRVDLYYLRGEDMVMRSGISPDKESRGPIFVDTSKSFPLALDKDGWQKAGLDVASLKPIEQNPEQKLKQGVVPVLRLGAYDVSKVPGLYGVPLGDIEKQLKLDVDGVIGAGLLAYFRITLGEEGRVMWIEDDTAAEKVLRGSGGRPAPVPVNAMQPPLPPEGGPLGEPLLAPGAAPLAPSDPSPGVAPLAQPGLRPVAPAPSPKPPSAPKKAPSKTPDQ